MLIDRSTVAMQNTDRSNGLPQAIPVASSLCDKPKTDPRAEASGMRILKLPPHMVRHHPDNPEITPADVTGLLASMRQDGQLQPGMVYPDLAQHGFW
jgi:hypothetical protein